MLMQLMAENQAIRIQKYYAKAISAFFVRYTLFYQNPLAYLEYIALNVFHAAEIVVSRVTQFEKMITQLKKSISINYSNND